MILKYTLNNNDTHINIKQILKEEFQMSDRLILKLKTNNRILCNNEISSVSKLVCISDNININLDFDEESLNIVAKKMDIDILYEDDAMLIINKKPNTPIHPSLLHYEDSLSNGVKYYFNSINLKRKIRPVNRLDRNTTGIVIFAKNEYIQECLIKQMKLKTFQKEYLALVEGILDKKSGTINAPIARKENSIIERKVDANGDMSITHYKVLHEKSNISLLSINLETGRTHQIRVHMAYIGHPIIGDTLYGKESNLILRQALHAYKVIFIHPITKEKILIESPIPDDFRGNSKKYEFIKIQKTDRFILSVLI